MIDKSRKTEVGSRKFTLRHANPQTLDFGLLTYDKYQNI